MKLEKFHSDAYEKIEKLPIFSDIGEYVEQTVVDVLSEYESATYFYPNPSIFVNTRGGQRNEIADMLFGSDETLLIIECKGRKTTNKNSEKLDRWLSKKLSEAKDQLQRAEKRIKDEKYLIGKSDEFHIIVDFSGIEIILPIIIFYEISDSFWREEIRNRKQKYPTIQIIDLKGFVILCKFLPDIDELISYLLHKQNLYLQYPEFIVYEELLLIYYLSNGKSFGELLEAKNLKALNLKFSEGIPWSISTSSLYDLSPQNISNLTHIFRAISKLGVKAWEKLVEEKRSELSIEGKMN